MSRKHALATDLLLDVIASFGNKVADLLQKIHGQRSGRSGSAQLFQLFQLSSGTQKAKDQGVDDFFGHVF
jgi:hypothetical protein